MQALKAGRVGLFFYINGRFFLHSCMLEKAEPYGDFLTYRRSHLEIWQERYRAQYGVDFDYFPRGRITYRVKDSLFLIYHDSCVEQEVRRLAALYPADSVRFCTDIHYQCHRCNQHYVV